MEPGREQRLVPDRCGNRAEHSPSKAVFIRSGRTSVNPAVRAPGKQTMPGDQVEVLDWAAHASGLMVGSLYILHCR